MVQVSPRGRNPFDEADVERDAQGVARYLDRPPSLVALLQASVERDPDATAVLEVGGPAITYGELWDRAARVAGGLQARCRARRPRRDQAGATASTGCSRSSARSCSARSSFR